MEILFNKALLQVAETVLRGRGEDPQLSQVCAYLSELKNDGWSQDPMEQLLNRMRWMELQHRAGLLMYSRIEQDVGKRGKISTER